MPRPLHVVVLALGVLSVLVLLRNAERDRLEDEARALAAAACERAPDPAECAEQARAAHERCFAANFTPGRVSRGNEEAARIRRPAYVACVGEGFESWNSARIEREREKREFEREVLR